MPDADEFAELRMLRAKAYGPGGGLSADELSRLQELEGRSPVGEEGPRLPSVAQPIASAAATPALDDPPMDAATDARELDLDPGLDPGPGSGLGPGLDPDVVSYPDAETGSFPRRRRWPILAAAAAVLLAVGLGIGWGIWGQPAPSIALTDEQRAWQDSLLAEDDEYDPGSLTAVREEDGVVVWTATKGFGERTCVLLSNGQESSAVCRETEQVKVDGLWGELVIPDEESENTTEFRHVTVLFSAGGHPAIVMNGYTQSSDGSSMYASEREQEIADSLVASGYARSGLWVVGYFEGDPVWMATPTGTSGDMCLIYVGPSGEPQESCVEQNGQPAEDLLLSIVDTDAPTPRTVEMSYVFSGPSSLTITVRPVTGVIVDTETGDVIDVTTLDGQ